MDLFSHMEENKEPADGSVAWALLVLCSLDLFGPTKWSEELTEKSAFLDLFGPTGENGKACR